MLRKLAILCAVLLLPLSSYAAEAVRIVIFSAPYGAGHDAAARGVATKIREEFQKIGLDVEILHKNSLDFAPPALAQQSLDNFVMLQSQFPKLYSAGFNAYLKLFENNYAIRKAILFFYKTLGITGAAMEKWMTTEAFKDAKGKSVLPDLIFSTWPGSTEALIHLREKTGMVYSLDGEPRRIRFAHVQTDNGTDSYFELIAKNSDAVFVPSRKVFEAYRNHGVDNLYLTGMPVTLEERDLPTYEDRQREKRQARLAQGLDPDLQTVMIEAGKNGAANYVGTIAAILAAKPDAKLNFIAACGEDKDGKKQALLRSFSRGAKRGTKEFDLIYDELRELVKPLNLKYIFRKGFGIFTNKAALTHEQAVAMIEAGAESYGAKILEKGYAPLGPLRLAADIVITKPGGLSTAEMGANGYMMMIMQEYASGEALPNGPTFRKMNLAMVNEDITQIGADIAEVLDNESIRREFYSASPAYRKEFRLDLVMNFVNAAKAEVDGRGFALPPAMKALSCAELFR